MAATKITGLTAKTTLAPTDLVPIVDMSGTPTTKKAVLSDIRGGYVLQAACAAFSPADSTTYYLGCEPSAAPTAAVGAIMIIPRTGTVSYISLVVRTIGTLGSAETSTIYYRHQNATDTAISSAVACNAVLYSTAATPSIAVAAGEFFEIKWVTPAWATNPTNVLVSVGVYVT